MYLLGIETTGKQGGVTLARVDGGFAVLETTPIPGGTFSAQLIPQISALLQKHSISPTELGGIAVATGPGSFTGLRVGLAAVKGLAEILNTPVVGISFLAAQASVSDGAHVIAMLDAQRSEIFAGEYQSGNCVREELLSREMATQLARSSAAAIVTPDTTVAESIGNARLVRRATSEDVARLGAQPLKSGQQQDIEQLDANYIRRSDAELNWKG